MRAILWTIEPDGQKKVAFLESSGQIYIDLHQNCFERVGPGEMNGFLGPECLIQMEKDAHGSHVVGIRIVPELGRDDSRYMQSLEKHEIPKV